MFSGRLSQCPLIFSVIRRAKSSDNKCKCVVGLLPKQSTSDILDFVKIPCSSTR